ncbi:MAG: SAM-dependent DNA methyltransferase [Candidatus Lokiarchaeota archaeon]|nr:SAM-dependent DNA methyltransferase [Candidatus Lokiarchaeota archaeon]
MAGRSEDLGLTRRDGKAYSTFYTEPWNAVLLASLALALPNPSWRFNDPAFYPEFKVADFACGGGMLLLATFHALEPRAHQAHERTGKPFSRDAFHREYIESCCHGFDVMEKALQMTRDALASACPDSNPSRWNLVHAPITPPDALGSLDLLKESPSAPALQLAKHKRYALVIMNPPFARSCGDNLQFGAGTDRGERMALDRVLTGIRASHGVQGIGQAGQAADFIVLAVESLAPGGRLAFIVPKSLIDGAAWLKLRKYLLDRVHVELFAFNFVPPGFSFSENTNLSECIVIARKRNPGEVTSEERTAIVNIMNNDMSSEQVQCIIASASEATRVEGQGSEGVFSIPSRLLADHVINWQQLFGLPSRVLHAALDELVRRSSIGGIPLPLTRLGDLASIGPDRSELTKKTSPVATGDPGALDFVWGRENAVMASIAVYSNQRRAFKAGTSDGIKRKFAGTMSHLLLPESIFLKTTRVFGCHAIEPVLSNISWSCKANDPGIEKAIALWSNSTLGILLLLAVRNEARGPWIHWKKVPLQEYLVPDPRRVSPGQWSSLISLFETCKNIAFKTIFEEDAARKMLDARMIDILVANEHRKGLDAVVRSIRDEMRGLKPVYC